VGLVKGNKKSESGHMGGKGFTLTKKEGSWWPKNLKKTEKKKGVLCHGFDWRGERIDSVRTPFLLKIRGGKRKTGFKRTGGERGEVPRQGFQGFAVAARHQRKRDLKRGAAVVEQ